MTATEFWNKLDELATSKDTSNALLEMANLLREAGDLGGLVFNPYDEKRSMALAKFLI